MSDAARFVPRALQGQGVPGPAAIVDQLGLTLSNKQWVRLGHGATCSDTNWYFPGVYPHLHLRLVQGVLANANRAVVFLVWSPGAQQLNVRSIDIYQDGGAYRGRRGAR